MTTLTVYRGRGGKWMVHSDRRNLPGIMRDAPVDDRYHGESAACVLIAVQDCNPGCAVTVEGEKHGR